MTLSIRRTSFLALLAALAPEAHAQVSGPVEDLVVICPERLAPSTRRKIERKEGQNALRKRQKYATIARYAEGRCRRANGNARSCIPLGTEPLKNGDVTIPMLQRPERVDEADEADSLSDAETADAGALLNRKDRALQLNLDACTLVACAEFEATTPGFCNKPSGIKLMEPKCVMPNCWTADGGWDDNAEVDCMWRGPDLSGATVTRWNGCNVMPKANAVGNACVPTNCEVVAGEGSLGL